MDCLICPKLLHHKVLSDLAWQMIVNGPVLKDGVWAPVVADVVETALTDAVAAPILSALLTYADENSQVFVRIQTEITKRFWKYSQHDMSFYVVDALLRRLRHVPIRIDPKRLTQVCSSSKPGNIASILWRLLKIDSKLNIDDSLVRLFLRRDTDFFEVLVALRNSRHRAILKYIDDKRYTRQFHGLNLRVVQECNLSCMRLDKKLSTFER